MRVISGSAKGKALKTLDDLSIRPTGDRVKEAVFSVIQFDVPNANVLDLFSGSGAMGIEALSRGAKNAVFVDISDKSLSVARQNLTACRLAERAALINKPHDSFIREYKGEKFDIAFLDPPYKKNLIIDAISLIDTCGVMSTYGIIICEASAEENIPKRIGSFTVRKSYRYGKTRVVIYHADLEKSDV
jgi:16S rRNA (guanine966-N2)-methyltransferase